MSQGQWSARGRHGQHLPARRGWNGTTVRGARILFPETAAFTPIEVPMAGDRIIVQLASYLPRCIVLQVRDGQGLSSHFPGLTDGQFPRGPADQGAFCHHGKPSIYQHVRCLCPQPWCGMTGKEQHFQLPQSLTSPHLQQQQPQHLTLACIVLAGHKTQVKFMYRAFDNVASLCRVALQCLTVVLSRVRFPRFPRAQSAHPLPTISAHTLP